MPETEQQEGQPVESSDENQVKPDEEALGEGGKKALVAERKRAKELEAKLSEASAKLDELNKANETALETAQREAAEARDVLAQMKSEAVKYRVAARFKISDEDADLFLTGSDEESLTKQAERIAEWSKPTGQPQPDPTQGGNNQRQKKTTADLFAGAFEGVL